MNTSAFFRQTSRAARRGFTLMEMLIVLTIIALLMGMVIMNVKDFGAGAKQTKAQADILAFKEMLAAYQLDNGVLPSTDQGIKALWAKPTVEPVPLRWHALLEQETLDPWGRPYKYINPGKHNPDKYDVYSVGEDGVDGTQDDIGNWPDQKTAQTQ